ncbi:aldehyde dehydrogenase family protein [Salinisphaera sp. Q1T1-3]|uniref:aldehyde dehydrogenase family protein n=1 Tax=Salinisphaera sp. Q1T1-3 TaxID=2321229 RepID=UPI000E710D63|nr:aldehyde dehydrogenase family protein [Salinisphaera sp. Q1T1-3]RJS94276.1 aldehyde dehydrogenase family protein [Salinisphaera sp. Q1T1-3]
MRNDDIDARIAAARGAQRAWQALPRSRRARLIGRIRHTLAEQADEVVAAVGDRFDRGPAETLTAEIIPLADAARFIQRSAARVLAPRRVGRAGRPAWLWGVRGRIERIPHGVVAIIAPGNYRLLLAGVQILQALAAGNAVVVKPAPGAAAPLVWLRAALIAAGLPADLFQLLDDETATGRALAGARIDKLVLTGARATGQAVARQLAARAVPAALELSGDDAVFVLDSADIEMTARSIVWGMGLNGGATCIAPRRIYVAAGRYPALVAALNEALAQAPARTVAEAPFAIAHRAIADAAAAGWHVLGRAPGSDTPHMAPCILAHAEADRPALPGDLFAPAASMIAVADIDEALRRDQSSRYALGAAVFGAPAAAHALADRLDAGMITINDLVVPTADPRVPFAGGRGSGYGATRGLEGLRAMTRPRVIMRRHTRARPHLAPPRPRDAALFKAYLGIAHGRRLAGRWAALKALLAAVRAA